MWFPVSASGVLGWITEFWGLSSLIFGNTFYLASSMVIHICLLFVLLSFPRIPSRVGGFLRLTIWMVKPGLLAVFICNILALLKSPKACTNLLEDAVPALGNFHQEPQGMETQTNEATRPRRMLTTTAMAFQKCGDAQGYSRYQYKCTIKMHNTMC